MTDLLESSDNYNFYGMICWRVEKVSGNASFGSSEFRKDPK